MAKLKRNRKFIIATFVLFALLLNIYIAFQNVNASAPIIDKQALCNGVGCPDTETRLCAEINATVGGTGVVYKCYEPMKVAN